MNDDGLFSMQDSFERCVGVRSGGRNGRIKTIQVQDHPCRPDLLWGDRSWHHFHPKGNVIIESVFKIIVVKACHEGSDFRP